MGITSYRVKSIQLLLMKSGGRNTPHYPSFYCIINRTHTLELRLSEGDIAEIFTRQLSKRSAVTEVLRNCIAVDSVQTEAKCILLAVSFPPFNGTTSIVPFRKPSSCTRHDQTRKVQICVIIEVKIWH